MNKKKHSHVRKSRYTAPSAARFYNQKKSAKPQHISASTSRHSQPSRHDHISKRHRPAVKFVFCISCILIIIFFAAKGIMVHLRTSSKNQPVSAKITESPEDVLEMEELKDITFNPRCTDTTKPENLISYTDVEVNGTVLNSVSD